MANKFTDLNEWLISEIGKNALELDRFSKGVQKAYKEQIEIGNKMHNIQSELAFIQAQYAKVGFTQVDIQETSSGTKIIFMPATGDVNAKDCPSLEISKSNNGLVFHNGMVAYNSPVALMSGNNELGFVSEASLALHQVGKQISQNVNRILQVRSSTERAKLVQSYTSKAFRESSELMSNLFDKKALKEMKEWDEKAVISKRPESIESQKNQLHYAQFLQQMYAKAEKSGKLDYGQNLKKFEQSFERVLNLARSVAGQQFKDAEDYLKEVEKGLRTNLSKNHQMLRLWDDGIKQFFAPIIKNITQGGMTEGTLGRIGLSEPEVPFSGIYNVGKKTTQNYQIFEQKSNHYKKDKGQIIDTVALNMNRLFTQAQKKQLEELGGEGYAHKDIYGVAYLSEQDLKKAFEKAKREYKEGKMEEETYRRFLPFFLKGFGSGDASLMSKSFAKEVFTPEVRPQRDLSTQLINDRMVERIKEQLKRKLNKQNAQASKSEKKTKQEINQIIDETVRDFDYFSFSNEDLQKKENKGYVDTFRKVLRRLYGLDDNTGLSHTGINGSGFDYKVEDGKITQVSTVRETSPYAQIGRGGATTDARSQISAGDDDWFKYVLESKFGEGSGRIKDVQIIKSSDSAHSHKTIASDIKGVLSYLIAKEGAQEVFNELGNYSSFLKIEGGDLIVDNKAVNDFFGELKETTNGKKKEFKNSVAQFYVDLTKIGNKLGLFAEDEVAEIKEITTKDGVEKYLVGGPSIMASEYGQSSTFSYGGLGELTGSQNKDTWRELHSVQNTYDNFSRFLLGQGKRGEEYAQAIAPLKKLKEQMEKDMFSELKGYQKYVQNAENVAQTFKKDAEQFQKEKTEEEGNLILTLAELQDLNASYEYNSEDPTNPGMSLEGQENNFALVMKRKAKDKFKELKAKYNTPEKWKVFSERTGIENADDLLGRIFVNLGDERVTGSYNGQQLSTGMVVLPKISIIEKSLKNGILALEDGSSEALRIADSLKNIKNGKFSDQALARRVAFSTIAKSYDDYRESLTRGALYEAFHVLQKDKSSGRLIANGLSEFSGDVLKELGLKDGQKVSMLLNPKDFRSMMTTRLKDKEYKEEMEKEINNLFTTLYAEEERKGFKGLKTTGKLDKIINAITVGNKDFKGMSISNVGVNRDPLINFLYDYLGGNLLLSDKTAQGNIQINKDLLRIGHGDMDGDIIRAYFAYRTGDGRAFEAALTDYFNHLAAHQKEISDREGAPDEEILNQLGIKGNKRIGAISQIERVQDQAAKSLTIGDMWSAKKGAGIFGDFVYGDENLFKSLGIKSLSLNDSVGNNGRLAFGAAAMQAIAQSLYQEGINVKNSARLAENLGLDPNKKYSAGEIAAMTKDQTDVMFDMVGQAATFNDIGQLRRFLEKGVTLGIFKEGQMFKDNTLGTFGLGDLNEEGYKNLLAIANDWKNQLEKAGAGNENYIKKINEDIDIIKDAANDTKTGASKLGGLSTELVAAMVMNLNSMGVYFPEGVGTPLANRYREGLVPGKGDVAIPFFNAASGENYDEQTKRFLSNQGFKNALNSSSYGQYYNFKNKNGKFLGWDIATSTKVNQLAVDLSKYGLAPKTDTRAILADAERVRKGEMTREEFGQLYDNFLTSDFNKDNLVSMPSGNISHLVSEYMTRYGEDFSTREDYKKDREEFDNRLIGLLGEEEAKKAIEQAELTGKQNTKYITDYIKRIGGETIGSEVFLTGYGHIDENTGDYRLRRQQADLMYKVGNKLVIGDIKNYSSGDLGLATILQIKDYAESTKWLKRAIQDQPAASANTFLYSDNKVAKDWLARYREQAKRDYGDEYNPDNPSQMAPYLAQFEELYKALNSGEDINQIVGQAFIRDKNKGLMYNYSIDLENDALNSLYKRYKQEHLDLDDFVDKEGDEAKIIRQQVGKLAGLTYVGGDEEIAKDFGKDFKDFNDLMNKIAKKKIEILNKSIEIASFNPIKEIEKKVAAKQQLHTLTEEEAELENQLSELKAKLNETKVSTSEGERSKGEILKSGFDEIEKQQEEMLDKKDKEATFLANQREFISLSNSYEDVAGSYFKAYHDAHSSIYTGEEKKKRKERLERERDNFDFYKNRMKTLYGRLTTEVKDEEGKSKIVFINQNGEAMSSEEEAEFLKNLGVYSLDDLNNGRARSAVDKKFSTRAKTDSRVEATRNLNHFSRDYRKYQGQIYELTQNLEDIRKQLADAEEKADQDQITLLKDKIVDAERLLEITKGAEPNWKDYKAYSKKEKDRLDEAMAIERKLKESNKNNSDKNNNNNGNGNNSGGGFLGIDKATTNWISRLMNGGAIYSFLRIIRKGFRDITNMAKQLDQAMTNLRIVTGKNAEDARTLITQYSKLGKELGATTVEITQSATAWLNSLGHDKINSSNCWEFLKLIKLQHKNEICLSVKVKNL